MRHRQDISSYYKSAMSPEQCDMDFLSDRGIEYYLANTHTPKDALGAICGWLLKYRHGMLGHVRKQKDVILIGQDVMEVMRRITSRKNKDVAVYSQAGAGRRLLDNTKPIWAKLFKRTKKWNNGNVQFLWSTLTLADALLVETVDLYLLKASLLQKPIFTLHHHPLLSDSSSLIYLSHFIASLSPISTRPSVTRIEERKKGQKQFHQAKKGSWFEPRKPQLFTVPFKTLRTFTYTSILHLLSVTVGFTHEGIVVSAHHTSSQNPNTHRHDNVFTRIKSVERLALGYISYDMSAAMQTISLQLIQASESDYPLLTRYTKDKQFKRQFRTTIANDLDVPMKQVKERLTSFANGGVQDKNRHSDYLAFYNESVQMLSEVMGKAPPHIVQMSKRKSKKKMTEDLTDIQKERVLASRFFFVWTYYERVIRKAMLPILTDGIEVHDAVYSKMDVSTKEIEATIFESTGFKIIIEKE